MFWFGFLAHQDARLGGAVRRDVPNGLPRVRPLAKHTGSGPLETILLLCNDLVLPPEAMQMINPAGLTPPKQRWRAMWHEKLDILWEDRSKNAPLAKRRKNSLTKRSPRSRN